MRVLQCYRVIKFVHLACSLLNHASNTVANFGHCSTASGHFVANGHASISSPPIQGCHNLVEGFYTNQFARLEIQHRDRRHFGVGSTNPVFSSNGAMKPQPEPPKEQLCNL